jgi:plastocyanin
MARAGQRYQITMRSDDFDSFLTLAKVVDGLTDNIATDDDGGQGNNARLRFTADASGAYVVLAQSLEANGMGSFTVRLDTLAPLRMPAPRAMAVGDSRESAIEDEDAEDEDGRRFDLYRVSGSSGDVITIDMTSSTFDPYVEIGTLMGGSFKSSESDDDSGEGTNARLTYTFSKTGDMFVRARPLSADSRGGYAIRVTRGRVAPAVESNSENSGGGTPSSNGREAGARQVAGTIDAGTSIEGTISDNDQLAADNTPFDEYRFTASAGESITFNMNASSMDAYLVLGRQDGNEFVRMETDDDSGGGTNAQITFRFQSGGEYRIRANVIGRSERGSYTLSMRRGS